MPSVTVKLATPVRYGDDLVREITLREPTYGNVLACGGPPYVPVVTAGGAYDVVDHERLPDYYRLLVAHPAGYALVSLLDVADGRALQRGLMSFFDGSLAATSGAASASS